MFAIPSPNTNTHLKMLCLIIHIGLFCSHYCILTCINFPTITSPAQGKISYPQSNMSPSQPPKQQSSNDFSTSSTAIPYAMYSLWCSHHCFNTFLLRLKTNPLKSTNQLLDLSDFLLSNISTSYYT